MKELRQKYRCIWAKAPYLSEDQIREFFAAVSLARESRSSHARDLYLASQEKILTSLVAERDRLNLLIGEVNNHQRNRETPMEMA